MLLIPIPRQNDEAALTWTTSLDGLFYRFSLTWEERAAGWYLDLEVASPSEPLVTGKRLTMFSDMFEVYRARVDGLPPGVIRLYSRNIINLSPPGFYDIGPGRRCFLVYMTQEEAQRPRTQEALIKLKKVQP